LQSLSDAVTLANGMNDAIILVAPGRYEVGATVHVLAPMTIKGSNVIEVDTDRLPTGVVTPGTETRVVGLPSLDTLPVIAVGLPTGMVTHDVTIANLTVQGWTARGTALAVVRTQRFTLHDNIIVGPAFNGITAFGSGAVRGNYVSGAMCGICIGAGNAESPSVVTVQGNRSIRNTGAGLTLNGVGTWLREFADQLDATVVGNDLSDNTGTVQSAGLRLFVIRKDTNSIPNMQSTGHIRAVVRGNRLRRNTIGLLIDAGFPYRIQATRCDPRTFSGALDIALAGDAISENTTASLVTFTRSVAALTGNYAPWQYLHNSTFTVSDPGGEIAGFRYDHPGTDPYIGVCPNDATHELLSNRLFYNDREIAPDRP
jgi:hypothetical protein